MGGNSKGEQHLCMSHFQIVALSIFHSSGSVKSRQVQPNTTYILDKGVAIDPTCINIGDLIACANDKKRIFRLQRT